MSLILPPWYFANEVDNLGATVAATLVGTNFTAAANNADGAAVSVLSALGFDAHYFVIGIAGIATSGANGQCLLDVLADPAGGTSWASLINDLVCGFTAATSTSVGINVWYHFPLYIPAGTSLGVQARTAHTADITSGRVVMYAFGNPSRPEMWWCGSKVESLGIDAANSSGTNVTAGNSNAWGSWTDIGSSTGRYGAIQLGINGSDATSAALGYQWQIGYGSNQLPGSHTIYLSTSTAESSAKTGMCIPVFCDIPSGTTIQARGKCGGTAEAYNLAAYGVY